jgi:hypothetical protein
MRIQQLGPMLALLALSCSESFAQEKEDEKRGHIRGGSGSGSEEPASDNSNSNNQDDYFQPKGYSNLKPVGKAPPHAMTSVVAEQGKHTKEFEEAHTHDEDFEGSHAQDAAASKPMMSQKEMSNIHHKAGVIEAKKQASAENNKDRSKKRRTRNLTDDGGKQHKECLRPAIQYIVTCKDDEELACRDELEKEGVEFIHMIHNTKYFAVCVDRKQEYATLMALADVQDIEEDPERSLKVVEGSHWVNERGLAQTVPYGVELVRAIQFATRFGSRGENVRVCVVDTGLDAAHDGLDGTTKNGSNDGDLVTPWFQDGDGHGTHVAGTVAAANNGIDVVGVAPNVDLFIARGEFVVVDV